MARSEAFISPEHVVFPGQVAFPGAGSIPRAPRAGDRASFSPRAVPAEAEHPSRRRGGSGADARLLSPHLGALSPYPDRAFARTARIIPLPRGGAGFRGGGDRGMPSGIGKTAQTPDLHRSKLWRCCNRFGGATSPPQTQPFPSDCLYFPSLDSRLSQAVAAVFGILHGDFGEDLPLAFANPRFCLLFPRPKPPLCFFSYFPLLCV